jgi:hypothetical protein
VSDHAVLSDPLPPIHPQVEVALGKEKGSPSGARSSHTSFRSLAPLTKQASNKTLIGLCPSSSALSGRASAAIPTQTRSASFLVGFIGETLKSARIYDCVQSFSFPWRWSLQNGPQKRRQGKTYMMRVFGFGLFIPASSVTVKETTNVPGVQ